LAGLSARTSQAEPHFCFNASKLRNTIAISGTRLIQSPSSLLPTPSARFILSINRTEDAYMASQAKILLVDDNAANLLALEVVLQPLQQELIKARSGEEALQLLLNDDFAVVLLDIRLGGMDGFEVAQSIRSQERSRHTPIIFITAFQSEEFPPAKAYTLGAVDYLVKPLVPEILRAKVEVFLALYQRTEQVRQLQRQQTEHEALHRFRAIIEYSWDGIALIGRDAVLHYVSPSSIRILGYTPEELVGHNAFEFMHPEDNERIQALFTRLVAQPGSIIPSVYRYRHKDGSWRWLEATGTNLLNDPSVQAIVVNCRDITEQRKAEQVRAELAAIVESSEDAIIGEDLQGIITSWNKGAERLYGYDAEEVVGKPVSLLHLEEGADELPNLLERLRRSEHIEPYETVRLRKDGSRVDVSLSVSVIKDSEGRVIGASKIARDIGPQKRLEEALRRHAEELAEAHRQKDQFLAMLAHELRNPMAPLRTGVHILRQSQTPPEVRERTHDMMDRQLRHLSRLVDDLLDVSRIVRGKIQLRKERLDLRRLVRTVAEDRRPVLEQVGLTLLLDVPETPVCVMGDHTRLTQVLSNLLDNSVKFAKGRNIVTVRLRADEEHGQAVLSVRDEGVGIEPELLPRLFTPFLQADRSLDRSRGGLGLGLAMVKGLAELHGGSVQAFSEGTGRGAEFTVRLPLEQEPPALSETSAAPQPSGKQLRILVIEDNRDAADSLRLLLQIMGHEARVAYAGPEGVTAAKEWRPEVVLCDIGLPGIDGFEVARQVRRLPGMAQTLLVAITGYGQEPDVKRSKEAGIDYHFLKPIDPAQLKQVLANAKK
jgi:PAS domain S-box-containing protein